MIPVRAAATWTMANTKKKQPRKRDMIATKARQLAQLRRGDARCLFAARHNERLAGSLYLGGYAIEAALRALLLERYPRLHVREQPVVKDSANPTNEEEARLRRHRLIHKAHDLGGLLAELPDLQERLLNAKGERLLEKMKSICSQWKVEVRYSAAARKREDVEGFLRNVEEVLPWLLGS